MQDIFNKLIDKIKNYLIQIHLIGAFCGNTVNY